MDRRRYLRRSGLAAVALTAGCLGDEEGEDPANGAEESANGGDADEGEDAELPSIGDEPLELGEGVVFFTDPGDAEISFTPSDADRSSVVTVEEHDDRVVVRIPDNGQVVTTGVEVSNTGEESVDVPGDVMVELNGESYRHLMNTGVGDEYDQYTTIDPDQRIERTLAFDIPDVDARYRLMTTWEARDLSGTLLSSTAEWELTPSDVPAPNERLGGLDIGDVVEVRGHRIRYEYSVIDIRTDAGEDEHTEVTVRVDNIGAEAIDDPIRHGLALLADGESLERKQAADSFEAGPLDSDESEQGVFAFDVGSADSYQFELQLTPYATAVWEP